MEYAFYTKPYEQINFISKVPFWQRVRYLLERYFQDVFALHREFGLRIAGSPSIHTWLTLFLTLSFLRNLVLFVDFAFYSHKNFVRFETPCFELSYRNYQIVNQLNLGIHRKES